MGLRELADNDEFARRYRERLDSIGVAAVRRGFHSISGARRSFCLNLVGVCSSYAIWTCPAGTLGSMLVAMGGAVSPHLASGLKQELGLVRAVETGTYRGWSARRLARVFPRVVTIELSPQLHQTAMKTLRDLPNVECRLGRSVDHLSELAHERVPTLYWLDAHWSPLFEASAGEADQCPVLDELKAIGPGDAADCFLIDDARVFCASPRPPYDPEHWPTLAEIFDTIRELHPGHYLTVVSDIVIGVPAGAKHVVDEFSRHPVRHWPPAARLARYLQLGVLRRVQRWAGER
ncbi:MAG: hypothetical protein AUG75_13605 [Cyanobacteria bacterium 13_1_20CM_4_61_6]|nr:MAG: hypothetical protein AUG75_13605 [Cyanobacteria bacterium 13_1_20CM_4_61_6]